MGMKIWIGFCGIVMILFIVFMIYGINKNIKQTKQLQSICSDNNMLSVMPYRTTFCIDDAGRMFYLR